MAAIDLFELKCDATWGKKLEAAIFATWPALSEKLCGGWTMRQAHGVTRRSNSVLPLNAPDGVLDDAISSVEDYYTSAKLAPCFRVSPFTKPDDLDGILNNRGYQIEGSSIVMTRPVDGYASERIKGLKPYSGSFCVPAWQEVSLGTLGQADTLAKVNIIAAAPKTQRFFFVRSGDKVIAAAWGVMIDGFAGLYAVSTLQSYQRQGAARTLTNQFMEWSAAVGAETAFLQVEEDNTAALSLYQSAGFTQAYKYRYRTKS